MYQYSIIQDEKDFCVVILYLGIFICVVCPSQFINNQYMNPFNKYHGDYYDWYILGRDVNINFINCCRVARDELIEMELIDE